MMSPIADTLSSRVSAGYHGHVGFRDQAGEEENRMVPA